MTPPEQIQPSQEGPENSSAESGQGNLVNENENDVGEGYSERLDSLEAEIFALGQRFEEGDLNIEADIGLVKKRFIVIYSELLKQTTSLNFTRLKKDLLLIRAQDLDTRLNTLTAKVRAANIPIAPVEVPVTDEQKLAAWKKDTASHPKEAKTLAALVAYSKQQLSDLDFDPEKAGNARLTFNATEQISNFIDKVVRYFVRTMERSMDPNEIRKADFLTNEYVEPAKVVLGLLRERVEKLSRERFDALILATPTIEDLMKLVAAGVPVAGDVPAAEIDNTIARIREAQRLAKESVPAITPQAVQEILEAEVWAVVQEKIDQLELKKYQTNFDPIIVLLKEIATLENRLERDDITTVSLDHLYMLLQKIKDQRRGLVDLGMFKEDQANLVLKKYSNEVDENIQKAQDTLEEKIAELTDVIERQPSRLPPKAIVDLVLKKGLDPFTWGSRRTGEIEPATAALLLAATGLVTREFSVREDELDRVHQATRLQLATLVGKTAFQDFKASASRKDLYEEIGIRLFTRESLLAGSTYHPTYGPEIETILDYLVDQGAKRKNDSGYLPALSYESLSGEKGTKELYPLLNKIFGEAGKGFHAEAIAMAASIFTGFDFLLIILRERQKMTQTQAHNAGAEDIDHNLIQDPTSTSIHRAFRYGGNSEDWSLWWLFYLEPLDGDDAFKEDLGILEADPLKWSLDYNEPSNPWTLLWRKRGLGKDAANLREIWQIQRLMRLHQNASFDILLSGVGGSVKIPDRLKSFFPDVRGYFKLSAGEAFWRVDELIDYKRRVILRKRTIPDEAISHQDGSPIDTLTLPAGKKVATVFATENNIFLAYEDKGILYDKTGAMLGPVDKVKIFSDKGEDVRLAQSGDSPDSSKDQFLYEMGGPNMVRAIDQYPVAEGGMMKLLEFAFKELGGPLFVGEVVAKVGGTDKKGGLIHQWLAAAGSAKMFPGDHLDLLLEPLLKHFIIRIFQRIPSTMALEARRKIFEEVIEALESSIKSSTTEGSGGGLAGYTHQIERVIAVLREKDSARMNRNSGMANWMFPGADYRKEERGVYLKAFYQARVLPRGDDKVPGTSWLAAFIPDGWLGTRNDATEYRAIVSGQAELPLPVHRDGNMYNPKEGAEASH